MPNTRQIVRQLDILRELVARKHGTTTQELANMFDVVTKTIERDLGDLSAAGFPLYAEKRGRQNYWNILGDTKLPPLNFPISEIIALTFVAGTASPLEGTPFKEAFAKMFHRLRTRLPEPMRALSRPPCARK